MSNRVDTFFDLLADKYGMDQAIYMDQWRRTMWTAAEYRPTAKQAEWLFAAALTKLVAGGVRSGKSYSSTRALDWFLGVDGFLIWIIGPDYEQAMMEFDYIVDLYEPMGLLSYKSRPKEGQCKLTVKGGAHVETKSSLDLRKLANKAPDVIMMVESGQHDEGAVEKTYERGLEKDAPIFLTGTFEGANTWYEDTYKEFQLPGNPIGGMSFSMPTWSNTVVFPGGKDDPKFTRAFHGIPEGLYMERVAAVPYNASGRVIRGMDRAVHCRPLEPIPTVPMYITVDPATHTYAVLFVQRIGRRVLVLDEIYDHNVITDDILPRVLNHDWLPMVKAVVMDQAGKQRQANRSVAEIWRSTLQLPVLTKYVLEKDNIDACNLRLKPDREDGDPNLLFNSNRIVYKRSGRNLAGGILAEADLWRYPETRKSQWSKAPVDANNDGWKALGYFLFREFGPVIQRKMRKRPKKRPRWYQAAEYYRPNGISVEYMQQQESRQ